MSYLERDTSLRAREFARWLFRRDQSSAGAKVVVVRWEKRRWAYNLIIGAWALVLVALLPVYFREPGGTAALFDIRLIDLVEIWSVFMIGANVCYTGGWIAELMIRLCSPSRHREVRSDCLGRWHSAVACCSGATARC
jgi:hypothetical protein